MKFNYQARDKKGDIKSGTIEASSKEAALGLLQRYGLYVTNLTEAKDTPFLAKKIKLFERISLADVVIFSRQLSIMFGAKVSLVESLRTLASQTKNQNFKERIMKISEEVEAGASFSMSLSKHAKVFPPFYVAMIKAGEASGKLSEALNYLANHLEREYYLVGKVKGAMVYPILILVVALTVLILVTVFVIPNLSRILEESGTELPLATKIVIGASKFLRSFGWAVLLALIGLGIFIFRWSKTKSGKDFFDNLFIRLPLFGSFLKMVYLARFAENFSTLISGGIPIAQSLEICSEIVGNTAYRRIILEAEDQVRKGEMISKVMGRFPERFPPLFTQMTAVGERTGTLDKTLMNVVSFYQQETERAIEGFLKILEPSLIVFLGLAVGGLMGAVLLPLYKISAV